jgi:hypothetical protein
LLLQIQKVEILAKFWEKNSLNYEKSEECIRYKRLVDLMLLKTKDTACTISPFHNCCKKIFQGNTIIPSINLALGSVQTTIALLTAYCTIMAFFARI